MTAAQEGSGKSNLRNLVAACAAISVFGFAFGMSYPLLSLILEAQGVSEEMIGINAAMSPIGILLFSPVIPVLSRRFGSRNTALFAALGTALLFIGYKAFPSLEAWFLLRLIQGMTISTLFVLSEAWVVKFASDSHRGRIVAIYGIVLSASFGAGPALIGWIGIEGWTPFLLSVAILLLGVFPLLSVQDDDDADPQEVSASGFFSIAARAPMLMAAVGVFAIFDAGTLGLLVVYGVRVGLDVSTAANALTALILGNILLQFPIGWLADRIAKRLVLAGCALVTLITCLILPQVMGSLWMWPVLAICGATGYGLYSVSLAALGDRFDGPDLVTGMAGFSIMWGSGALLGSIIGGWAMAGFGPHGLPYVLAAVFAVYLTGLAVRAIYLRR